MRRGSDDVTWAEHRPDDSDRNVTRRHITPTLLLVTVLPGHDVVYRHRFRAMPLVKTRKLTYHPYKTNSGKSRKDLQRVRKALITKKKKENTRRIAQRLILSGTRREWPSLFLHGETTRGKKKKLDWFPAQMPNYLAFPEFCYEDSPGAEQNDEPSHTFRRSRGGCERTQTPICVVDRNK